MRLSVLIGSAGVVAAALALTACNEAPNEPRNETLNEPVPESMELEPRTGPVVNDDTIEGNWKQLKGKMKEKWGKLTDDDLLVAEGNAEYLSGKLQERYGITREEAERQVKELEEELRK